MIIIDHLDLLAAATYSICRAVAVLLVRPVQTVLDAGVKHARMTVAVQSKLRALPSVETLPRTVIIYGDTAPTHRAATHTHARFGSAFRSDCSLFWSGQTKRALHSQFGTTHCHEHAGCFERTCLVRRESSPAVTSLAEREAIAAIRRVGMHACPEAVPLIAVKEHVDVGLGVFEQRWV
jgi:hypothetical protein